MRILLVDSISSPINQSNVQGLINAYRHVGAVETYDYRKITKKIGKAAMNARLIQVAAEYNPALIHLEKCEQLLGNTVKQIRQITSAKIVHVFPDYRSSLPTYVANICPHVDWSLYPHAEVQWARQCLKARATRLGFWTRGVDPEVFKPHRTPNTRNSYPLLMMANRAGDPAPGTGQGARGKFLKHLADAGLQIHLFGTGNAKFARKDTGIHAHKHVDLKQFASTIAEADISLAYNAGHISMYCSWRRIFNTLACEGFLLIRYFPGLETVFENRKHLVWFKTPEEAVDLIDQYIYDREARAEIARQGRAEVVARHTWDIRIERMLNLAFKNLDSPKFAR